MYSRTAYVRPFFGEYITHPRLPCSICRAVKPTVHLGAGQRHLTSVAKSQSLAQYSAPRAISNNHSVEALDQLTSAAKIM